MADKRVGKELSVAGKLVSRSRSAATWSNSTLLAYSYGKRQASSVLPARYRTFHVRKSSFELSIVQLDIHLQHLTNVEDRIGAEKDSMPCTAGSIAGAFWLSDSFLSIN